MALLEDWFRVFRAVGEVRVFTVVRVVRQPCWHSIGPSASTHFAFCYFHHGAATEEDPNGRQGA